MEDRPINGLPKLAEWNFFFHAVKELFAENQIQVTNNVWVSECLLFSYPICKLPRITRKVTVGNSTHNYLDLWHDLLRLLS